MCIYFRSLAIYQLIESWVGVLVMYTQHWLCTHWHTQMRGIGRGEIRWCFQTKQAASWKINILALFDVLLSFFLDGLILFLVLILYMHQQYLVWLQLTNARFPRLLMLI